MVHVNKVWAITKPTWHNAGRRISGRRADSPSLQPSTDRCAAANGPVDYRANVTGMTRVGKPPAADHNLSGICNVTFHVDAPVS
jgi:hypothetical protein